MAQLLASVLPLAAAAAFSPPVLTVSVLLLSSPQRGLARCTMFNAGALVALVGFSVVGLTVLSAVTDHSSATRDKVSAAIDVVIGLLLLALAVRSLVERHHADDETGTRADRAARGGLGGAFVAGVSLMVANVTVIVFYLPAMKEVTTSEASNAEKLVVVVLALLITAVPAWFPLIVRLTLPGPSLRFLNALNAAIHRHRRAIVVTVELVFGVYLLAKGL